MGVFVYVLVIESLKYILVNFKIYVYSDNIR